MANRKYTAGGKGRTHGYGRFLRFGLIPLMVVVLVIIILMVDHQKQGGNDSSVPATEEVFNTGQEDGDRNTADGLEDSQEYGDAPDESKEEETPLAAADPAEYPLLKDTNLELTGLVQLYCDAKKECDPELLAQVFGISGWSEEEMEAQRSSMELVKASIKSYENISCYLIQGLEEESYVIFPYYEIRYRQTETLMPSISWAYVRRNEDGQYYIVRETESAVNDYIQKVGDKPEVKAVLAQVQAQQQAAIDSDEVLGRIYGSLDGPEVVIGGTSR